MEAIHYAAHIARLPTIYEAAPMAPFPAAALDWRQRRPSTCNAENQQTIVMEQQRQTMEGHQRALQSQLQMEQVRKKCTGDKAQVRPVLL